MSLIGGAAGIATDLSAFSAATGSQFSNSSPPVRIIRFNDKLAVGPGSTGWNGLLLAQGGAGSWLFSEGEGASKMSYLLVNAVGAFVTSGDQSTGAPYGVFGASRTPASANAYTALGVAGYAAGYSTGATAVPIWGGYFDAVKGAGATNVAQGIEVEITNLEPSAVADYTPYSSFVRGRTYGVVVGAGAGTAVHPISYPSSAAINIFNNGSTHQAGIVMRSDALMDVGSGYMSAMRVPRKARIEWYNSDSISTGIGYSIDGDISDAAHRILNIADDTGWALYNNGGAKIINVPYVANAVNYLSLSPNITGGPPGMAAAGTNADISMTFTPKGAGGVRMRGGDSTVKIEASTTGIGFFATSPVARQSISGAKAGNTAIAGIIAVLVAYGLATDATT